MRLRIPKFISEATGHIKLSKYPMWVQYKPHLHAVKGPDVRRVLDIVEPGDILLRRFDGYLNTIFTPGFFGHAGLFVGRNNVVHSISRGCVQEDILNFCRCDAVCILTTLDANIPEAIRLAKIYANKDIPYDYQFAGDNDKFYCTELIDAVFKDIFYADYTETIGGLILMPDGIFNSKAVKLKLQINYREVVK